MEERKTYALYIKETADPKLLKRIIQGFILVTQEFCSVKVITTRVENHSPEKAQRQQGFDQQGLDPWLS